MCVSKYGVLFSILCVRIGALEVPRSKIMTDDSSQNYVSPTMVPYQASTSPPLVYSTFPSAPPVTTTPSNGYIRAAEKCNEYHRWILKKSTFQFFIIKGTSSMAKEFPHMAALGYGPKDNIQWLCGGSLISEQFVLTAAHCLTSNELGGVKWVRMGDTNLEGDNGHVQMFETQDTFAHPEYSAQTKYNDIALVKLDRPVEFSEYALPICLSTSTFDVKERLIATGWGNTDANGARSQTLMRVNLDYFGNDECRKAYGGNAKDLPNGVLADRQICAGSRTDERDTCQGDSGGPLQINTDKLYLVGITSVGQACGKINTPAIYTNVYYYIPWLEKIAWIN